MTSEKVAQNVFFLKNSNVTIWLLILLVSKHHNYKNHN